MKKDTHTKKAAITSDTVEKVIEYHFNKKPKVITQLYGGAANFAFEVELGKDKYIVRISDKTKKLQYFLKEQWAVDKAREKDVPTPEILEVGNEVVPFPYMVIRKVEGIDAHLHPNRLKILEEMGRYTGIINSISTIGYGHVFDWSNNTLSKRDTWKEYLEREFDIAGRLKTFEEFKLLSVHQLKKLKSDLKLIEELKIKPTLNHGDMRMKNVIVDEKGKIIAIHDWENCLSSISPQWDLSIALHDLGIDEKEAFLKGYGISSDEYTKISPGIKILNILNYASAFISAKDNKNKEVMESIRHRMKGVFDAFTL